MKCAIFEEHSSSCVVYFRFSGTLFPVSMIDGAHAVRPIVCKDFQQTTIAGEELADIMVMLQCNTFTILNGYGKHILNYKRNPSVTSRANYGNQN